MFPTQCCQRQRNSPLFLSIGQVSVHVQTTALTTDLISSAYMDLAKQEYCIPVPVQPHETMHDFERALMEQAQDLA